MTTQERALIFLLASSAVIISFDKWLPQFGSAWLLLAIATIAIAGYLTRE